MKTLVDNRFRSKFAKDKAKRLQWSKNANAAKQRKADEIAKDLPPITYAIETVDPLYTLVFTDHLIGKEYVFTLHGSNRIDQFKINVNGVPWKDCGWTDLMAEIRKKRVKIGRMR